MDGQNLSQAQSIEMMRHKAEKYHYKIQLFIRQNYIAKGLNVPEGYAPYMQPFRG